MPLLASLLILLAAGNASAAPKRLVIPILEATSPADHETRSIFSRDGWRPEQLGRVIVHLVAQAPFDFGGMDLDNCGTAELEYWFFAGGKQITPSVAQSPVRTDDLVIVLTGVDDLCLSNGRILDEKRSPYQLVFSDNVTGEVRASSILAPEHSYHPMRLFDDDLARSWSSNGRALNERLDFELAEETTIDGIILWGGDQRSETRFRANARPKILTLSSEGLADVRLEAQDTLGSQTITLPRPWSGRRFSLKAAEVTRGGRANNLMISELRLVSGAKILSLDSRAFDDEVAQQMRASFQTARLHGALDRALRAKALTLFLWSSGAMVAATRTHLVHGTMTVKKAEPNRLTLAIVGTVRDQRVPGDSHEPFTGRLTLAAGQNGAVRVTRSSSKRIPKATLKPMASE